MGLIVMVAIGDGARCWRGERFRHWLVVRKEGNGDEMGWDERDGGERMEKMLWPKGALCFCLLTKKVRKCGQCWAGSTDRADPKNNQWEGMKITPRHTQFNSARHSRQASQVGERAGGWASGRAMQWPMRGEQLRKRRKEKRGVGGES